MSSKRLAASIALASALAAECSPAAASTHQRYQSDGWILQIQSDQFTNLTFCSLRSVDRRLSYQPGGVGFLLGRKRDTLASWYRIGEGPPVRWQDRTSALIAAGVRLDGPALDNPTGGWVWLPVKEIEGAQSVLIRSDDRARVQRFRVRGFATMLDAAHRLGCVSDASFRS